jgi:hypothetical protein
MPTARGETYVLGRLSLALLFSSCAHGVQAFSVEPPLVCPGQTVVVRWQVQGRASLRAERGSNDWDQEDVPSQGQRSLALATPTTFTLRAVDANPAAGHASAIKQADVAQGPTEKAVASTCDAEAGKCRGTFELAASQGLMVRSLAAPKIVRAGHVQGGRICVRHAGLPTTCLAADERVAVAVSAGGPWTLETDLPTDDPNGPAPQLRLQMGFGCP